MSYRGTFNPQTSAYTPGALTAPHFKPQETRPNKTGWFLTTQTIQGYRKEEKWNEQFF